MCVWGGGGGGMRGCSSWLAVCILELETCFTPRYILLVACHIIALAFSPEGLFSKHSLLGLDFRPNNFPMVHSDVI